ncbi:MAG: hypothetical protein FWD31_06110 [Planctomycetaceae bacterium]|nr:hypothetical protein [Planctomycetaceae bacterium]
MYTRTFFFILTVLMFMAVGCGDNVPMRGKVTFSDDNSPLTAGMVSFTSDTLLARGHLKPNGTYVIGTNTEKDGLPKGTYIVTISDAVEIVPPPPNASGLPGPTVMRQLIAPLEPKTVVVDGKTKVYNIVVDRPK